MSKFYTGVGSRATPAQVQDDMVRLGNALGRRGWTLRSGGAAGADTAFEVGAVDFYKEIWLPWRGYNAHTSPLYIPSIYMEDGLAHWNARCYGEVLSQALQIARAIHPAWNMLDDTGRRFHIRNVFRVLGRKLDAPSRFVVCWTPRGEEVGGTRTAMVLARERGIPVFNMFDMSLDDVLDAVNEIVVDKCEVPQ